MNAFMTGPFRSLADGGAGPEGRPGPVGGQALPVVIGEGLKPLTTSQRPSDSSHRKIGAVAIAANTVTGWLPRNSVAVADAMSSGAPISPSTGMTRGTSPDRYSNEPRSRALMPGMSPGPSRKVQSRTATSALPAVTSEAGAVPGAPARSWRRVTTASRLTTPMARRCPTAQAPAQSWTRDQPAPELWGMELGLDQGACHDGSPHGHCAGMRTRVGHAAGPWSRSARAAARGHGDLAAGRLDPDR